MRNTYYLDEPAVVIEVLSPTTEARDRLEKRITYQRLPSLQEYVLISQEQPSVEVFRRCDDGWELERFSAGEIFRLSSVGFTARVDDVYRGII